MREVERERVCFGEMERERVCFGATAVTLARLQLTSRVSRTGIVSAAYRPCDDKSEGDL